MEAAQQQEVINKASVYWQNGSPLKAGMVIFEYIPLEFRPLWAASILEFIVAHTGHLPEIDAVLEFARYPENWSPSRYHEAHGIFDNIRDLKDSLADPDSVEYQRLELAENAAAITYTARQYPAPFDHSKGWAIVENLHTLVYKLALDAKTAWSIVSSKKFITLNDPITCHPACPICASGSLHLDHIKLSVQ